MHMADWITGLYAFLTRNKGKILTHAGSISHDPPLAHAEHECEKFHQQRQLEAGKQESAFDKAIKSCCPARNRIAINNCHSLPKYGYADTI